MFAVPGWNLSAKPLAQEKPTSTNSASHLDQASKKRKRTSNSAEASRKIEGAELERLWNNNFGGQKQKKKKKEKKSKGEQDDAGNGVDQSQQHGRPNGAEDGKLTSDPSEDKKKSKMDKKKSAKDDSSDNIVAIKDALPPAPPAPTNLTPLQQKMHSKLTSARFRHLNQTLYTTPSTAALELFKTNPSLFTEYHLGFTQQVQTSWPINPVDIFAQNILNRAGIPSTSTKSKGKSNTATSTTSDLPRRKTGSCTIADLGSGDAPLARTLTAHPKFKSLHLRIHSYDLHAPNSHVTVADIANLPLRDGEADIAIFCLSLMGTNWIDFVEEAWRILRGDGKGELWVAEVKSRFGRKGEGRGEVVEHSVGKRRKVPKKKQVQDEEDVTEAFAEENEAGDDDTTDLGPFIAILQRRGFVLNPTSVDKSNKMFVSMRFVKSGVPAKGKYKGWKWNGKEYAKQHDGKMRFTGDEEDEGVSLEAERKALKPCVYKLR
jgi:ribosomal RNA-processing protein 8